ncbi:DUF2333 family protein [bacterium]|nr:DUF2333 family protein [bacterium]
MSSVYKIVLAVLAVLAAATPFALDGMQKVHDQLSVVYVRPEGGVDPVPGENFATAAATIMEHELDGPTGWRPNDLPPLGPSIGADNNSNRQLGILQALRESVRVFKDHLTKISSDLFDPNLVSADNNLRNDPRKWMFPSAESRYREAVRNLRDYVAGLKSSPPKSRPINGRNIELIRLVQAWGDLLGDGHAELYKTDPSWFQIDDIYYKVQGYCHAIAHMTPAVEIEYRRELASRPQLAQLFAEIQAPLERCAMMKPLVVFNGRDTSMLANHRRNLDIYVTEARQKLYSIREELEK